jgi:DNA-binding NtrC family response regulator
MSPRSDETATMARRPPPPLGVVLRITGAPASATELRLERGRCVVGAGESADLILDDKAVSRTHVELTLVPEGVAVRDLGSRNGTFYLGQRVERMVLSPGSRITIGSAEIAIDADVAAIGDGGADNNAYGGLLGDSAPMRRLFAILRRLEGALVNVLVQGESGVGKELIARAIHEGSQLSDGPLLVVNGGAIGKELVLSELFGHKKGAFTGATDARIGAFEAAHGGTLFLDEVGELPLEVQPVLLRALESGEIKPLGGNDTKTVKVRIVAATNRDLKEEVSEGRFREDLYYRLAVVTLKVPPLRDRLDDVPLLAAAFANQAGAGDLPREVVQQLTARRWPGNARELKNAVLAHLAIGTLPDSDVAPAGLIEMALRQSVDTDVSYQDQKEAFLALFSRVYFEALLERAGGNQSEAARIGGIERSYLRKLLEKYGVNR